MSIIDRRSQGQSKAKINRKKFLDRYKKAVKRSVEQSDKGKGITDILDGRDITIRPDTIDEPQWSHDPKSGDKDRVLPGNKQYNKGDKINKPQGGNGESGRQGSDSGEGDDEFSFTLSKEEFLELYFSDMALPNFVKKSVKMSLQNKFKRAGFVKQGIPPRLNVKKTFENAIARKISQKAQGNEKPPFLDDIDLRYDNVIQEKKPIAHAVMFCLDSETEYLSPEGWVKIKDYNKGKVAQYSKDGDVSFVQPLNYIHNPQDTKFYHIKNSAVDQMVTSEHRVIYKNSTGNIREIKAKDLEERHNNLKYGFRGKIPTSFKVDREGMPLTDAELRFHIAFKADGTYQRNNDSNTRAQFVFSKHRKIKRLVKILEELNWEYNKTDYGIYVSTPHRISKRFDSEWYEADNHQLEIIKEEVCLWDGTNKTFVSKHKEDCDFVQYVWSATGHGTNLIFCNGVWIATRCKSKDRALGTNKITEVTLEGGSYCFTVPTGMFIARRNGKVFITGNCLMDVSASMGEFEKKCAKKFFLLLYLFLSKCYQSVEIRFIRHTQDADEVTEQEFFYGTRTGGTIVSSGLKLVNDIIDKEYQLSTTNIYLAQCSDGDNWYTDNSEVKEVIEERLLQKVQYFAYLEVTDELSIEVRRNFANASSLYDLYEPIAKQNQHFNIRMVVSEADIYPVLKDLFKRKGGNDE